MKRLLLLLAALVKNITPFKDIDKPNSLQCEVGDVVQNQKIICTCSIAFIYDCSYKESSSISQQALSLAKASCEPNKIYVEDATTCICNHDGTWPHRDCKDVFDSLPVSRVVKTKCKPDAYVFIGCNVCRCDSNGNINSTRCTKNKCHTNKDTRRSTKDSVYGNCESKNWYSLAPCQFCYCLNENKLVCNTGNHLSEKLQLGTYSLNVCGRDLIREAIELIPDEKNQSFRHGEGKSNFTDTSRSKDGVKRGLLNKVRNNIEFEINVDNANIENNESIEKLEEKDTTLEEMEEDSREDQRDDLDENNDNNIRIISSTQLPFQDDSQMVSKEVLVKKADTEEEENIDNNIDEDVNKHSGLDIPVRPSINLGATEYKIPGKKLTMKNLEDLGEQLKAHLPTMLDKVFRMALRKSMVTIDNDSNCVPGAMIIVKCNTCFCMKNAKMLCTNNECSEKS